MDLINDALELGLNVSFDVTSPSKAYAGHTVYRLTLKTQSSNHEDTVKNEFISWKRFSEFKKLHKTLKADFETIFLSYPEFAKSKVFGRFDKDVIEERRLSSIQLMNFIIKFPVMVQHPAFQVFIKKRPSTSKSTSSVSLPLTNNQQVPQLLPGLGSTIESIDMPETQSIESGDGCVNSNVILDADDLDDVFLANYDDNPRRLWLREARSICGDDLESLAEAPCDLPDADLFDSTYILLDEPSNDTVLLSNNSILSDLTSTSHSLQFQSKFKFQVNDKMSRIISKTIAEDDYIFQASVSMSNAIEQEELGNFDDAFEMYKFGIGLLLRGVQVDDNADRQEAVRRKTAQYLLRAEQLYNTKLHPSGSIEETIVLDDNKWRFRLSDVRVFGVINNVMLVQKIYVDEVFVMKVLHKQGGVYKHKVRQKNQRNLYNSNFMVKLINCVETQTGIYLLLQYVQVRLWDFLNLPILFSNYLQINSVNEYWNCENGVNTCENKVDSSDIKSNSISCDFSGFIKKLSLKSYQDKIKIWAAQIVFGVSELHSKGIICRDLNPLNILLDSNGVVKLTYFSNVEGIDYNINLDAIRYLYTSPEVNGVFDNVTSTDWWSVGALLFELITGKSLYSCHPDGITNRSVIVLPKMISTEAHSLLAGLLKFSPEERLGGGRTGCEEIKSHVYFSGIDWEAKKII
ncbi:ribosomal protein S6 kinase delta-1 isoform X2 [Hydra vulgaris]|uniref:Ribosomal protein S6 kinase delta-1 isoform X2 n=1 Tax=Hydra vulgaris TaxID=6087 RepID=A0ABM4CKJ9_HYDVU